MAEFSLYVEMVPLLPGSDESHTVRVRGQSLVLVHFLQLTPPARWQGVNFINVLLGESSSMVAHTYLKHVSVPVGPVMILNNVTLKYLEIRPSLLFFHVFSRPSMYSST